MTFQSLNPSTFNSLANGKLQHFHAIHQHTALFNVLPSFTSTSLRIGYATPDTFFYAAVVCQKLINVI